MPEARTSMENGVFQVRFWGVRGSIPVCGPQYERFGGNTACVEMRCGGHTLLFDAGSGLRPAGAALRGLKLTDLDLFFTHCHYDHILGFPYFALLYDEHVRLSVWSGHLAGRMTTLQMLEEFMRAPWFPARLDVCRANLVSHDFNSGDVLKPRKGVTIRTGSLNHPDGCIGYRVEWGGRTVALISDTEHEEGRLDPVVLDLIGHADLVIYDCTYTEAEMPRRKGFGHSTWQQGVKLCKAAGARKLALFHHDPARSDAELEVLERDAASAFAGAFAARDGQVLNFARLHTS